VDADENDKNYTREKAEEVFSRYFGNFKITQPSQYFLDHPTDDSDLCSNIQTPLEFVFDTLEFFNLPPKYIEGQGHHPDFGKDKDKSATAKLRAKKKLKQVKGNNKIQDLQNQMKDNEEPKAPSYFDFEPFLKAVKLFTECDGTTRSKLRVEVKQYSDFLEQIFVDEHGESSFKKCIDVMTIEKKFKEKGITFS